MPQFRKTISDDISTVCLQLLSQDGGQFGYVYVSERMSSRSYKDSGPTYPHLPAVEAWRIAARKSDETGLTIAVIDPDDVWQAEWGDLE